MEAFDPRKIREVVIGFAPPVAVPFDFFISECLDRLTHISKDAAPHVRQQAIAFQAEMRVEIERSMTRARYSDRHRLAALVRRQGEPTIAEFIEQHEGDF